jgi:hypothetical protein
LVRTTWSNNQPGPFQTEIFAATLAAAVVITAKEHNKASIVALSIVDHLLECKTHGSTILFVAVRLDQVN